MKLRLIRISPLKRYLPRGFTLIELMIVLTLIAILTAIAVPTYTDFAVRTKVSEALSLADGIKTMIAEYYMTTGSWPHNNESAGLVESTQIQGEYVNGISVKDNEIDIIFKATAGIGLADKHLILDATDQKGSITWHCKSPDIANKHLPAWCRTQDDER